MLNFLVNSNFEQYFTNQVIFGSIIVVGLVTGSYFLGTRVYKYYTNVDDSILNNNDDKLALFKTMINDAYNEQINNLSDNSSTIKANDSTPKNKFVELDDKSVNAVPNTTEVSISPIVKTSEVSISPIVKTSEIGVQTSDDLMLDLYKEWLYGSTAPIYTWSDRDILNYINNHPSETSPVENRRNSISENVSPGGSNYNLDTLNEELLVLNKIKQALKTKFSTTSSSVESNVKFSISENSSNVSNSPLPIKFDIPLPVQLKTENLQVPDNSPLTSSSNINEFMDESNINNIVELLEFILKNK